MTGLELVLKQLLSPDAMASIFAWDQFRRTSARGCLATVRIQCVAGQNQVESADRGQGLELLEAAHGYGLVLRFQRMAALVEF